MAFARPRFSMQHRITASVALGLAVILGVFAYMAVSTVNQSRDAALQERMTWAKARSAHTDEILRRDLDNVKHLAAEVAGVWEREGLYAGPLPAHYQPEISADQIALFADDGTLVSSQSPLLNRTLRLTEAAVNAVKMNADSGPQPLACRDLLGVQESKVCLTAPIKDPTGKVTGILVSLVDPLSLIPSPQLGEQAHIELLNNLGWTVASDLPPLVGTNVHAALLGPFVTSGNQGVVIHKATKNSPFKTHIVAYAPITAIPGWGVAVEQRSDIALVVADRLKRQFLFFGLLALVGAVFLAWLDVRRVVRPLRALTFTAVRMAAGDLQTPVSVRGHDEVGTLARAFEGMRSQLKGSLEELEKRDRDLEERVQQRTREVQELYEELQRRDEVRAHLLEKVISAQEEERGRIARELHDEAGQAITGILMSLEAVEASPIVKDVTVKERLTKAKIAAINTIDEIRRLVVDLRPAALDDLGLLPALRAYAENRLGDSGVRVEIEAHGLKNRLAPHLEVALFRVAQEAVTNIARHAEAGTAHIRLWQDNGRLTLTVEDDGKGFDMAAVLGSADTTKVLGLLGMQERVALCGGSLTVESSLGRGTRVRAEISLAED